MKQTGRKTGFKVMLGRLGRKIRAGKVAVFRKTLLGCSGVPAVTILVICLIIR